MKEKEGEKLASVVSKLFEDHKIPVLKRSYPIFTRIHRLQKLPNSDPAKPRPIIMRFHHHCDRQDVWFNRKLLGEAMYITEDFPREVKEKRKKIAPFLAKAKRMATVKNAGMRGERLLIDGKLYTEDQLSKEIQFSKESLSTQKKDNVTAFFGKDSKLSNFHQCSLQVDENAYCSVEQYYATEKASFAGKEDVAKAIMSNAKPEFAKQKSKELSKDFSVSQKKKWDSMSVAVMCKGVLAKFSQNQELKEYLLATNDDQIAEGSADKFWGCGFRLEDDRVFEAEKWRGKNMAGKLLEEVRKSLH